MKGTLLTDSTGAEVQKVRRFFFPQPCCQIYERRLWKDSLKRSPLLFLQHDVAAAGLKGNCPLVHSQSQNNEDRDRRKSSDLGKKGRRQSVVWHSSVSHLQLWWWDPEGMWSQWGPLPRDLLNNVQCDPSGLRQYDVPIMVRVGYCGVWAAPSSAG